MMNYLHYDKYNNVVGYSTMPVSNPEFVCKEVSQEEFDLFMSKEKDKELNEQRKVEIRERLNQLSQDLVQAMAGAYFEDFAQRQLEFQALHNELRVLEGKEPREYKKEENSIE